MYNFLISFHHIYIPQFFLQHLFFQHILLYKYFYFFVLLALILNSYELLLLENLRLKIFYYFFHKVFLYESLYYFRLLKNHLYHIYKNLNGSYLMMEEILALFDILSLGKILGLI